MKNFLLLNILLLLFTTARADRGDIVSWEHRNFLSFNEIDSIFNLLQVPPGIVPVNHELDMYKVVYETIGPRGGQTVASGVVAFPVQGRCAYPLASYQHGTIIRKDGVPSSNNPGAEIYLGILLATDGYIVQLPDYLGLGEGPGLHPYQHGKTEASAVIDMIRATRHLADSVESRMTDEVFLFGYSQGGHATMFTHKEIEEFHSDEITVTASAPMSGAYDMSGTMVDVMLSNDSYSVPGYLPYMLLGFKEAEPVLDSLTVNEVFASPYNSTLPPLFDGNYGMGDVNNAMPSIPKLIIDTNVLQDFINDSINHPLRIALANSDAYNFTPVAPINMYYCTNDEQVTYLNSLAAMDYFQSIGANNVQANNMGHLNHGECVRPALINAKSWLDGIKRPNDQFIVSYEVLGASTASGTDGTIDLAIENGSSASYAVLWSNGDTSMSRSGLSPGSYEATVTGSNGCLREIEVVVGVSCHQPSGMATSNVTAASAILNWLSVPGAAGYLIRGNRSGSAGYVELTVTGGTENRYRVTGLQASEDYFWQIRTLCDTAESAWSDEVEFKTKCISPGFPSTSQISSTSARLNWFEVPGADGYQIRGREVGGTWISFNIPSAGTTRFNANGLTPGTSYEWTIRSICDESSVPVDYSGFTDVITFSTSGAAKLNAQEPRIQLHEFSAYPNPADDLLMIRTGSVHDNARLEIFNALGSLVISQNVKANTEHRIDLKAIPSGLYFIKLSGADYAKSQPLIIR